MVGIPAFRTPPSLEALNAIETLTASAVRVARGRGVADARARSGRPGARRGGPAHPDARRGAASGHPARVQRASVRDLSAARGRGYRARAHGAVPLRGLLPRRAAGPARISPNRRALAGV